jgi:hypothetical protein
MGEARRIEASDLADQTYRRDRSCIHSFHPSSALWVTPRIKLYVSAIAFSPRRVSSFTSAKCLNDRKAYTTPPALASRLTASAARRIDVGIAFDYQRGKADVK